MPPVCRRNPATRSRNPRPSSREFTAVGDNKDNGQGGAEGIRAAPPAAAAGPVTLVLLGASNLSRACRALSRCLRANLRPRTVNILAALGPGRGYAAAGGLWPLEYPPIRSSPVFSAARAAAGRGDRVMAFITDIGNDLLYNVNGEELTQALACVIERLHEARADILVTPIHPVLTEILTPEWYSFLRTWLYPKSRVPYEQVIAGIESINRFLETRERAGHLSRVAGMEAFLGWDHVHYGWFRATGAWTRAAESILTRAGRPCRWPVTLDHMLGSYLENAVRLVGGDLLKLDRLRPGFF